MVHRCYRRQRRDIELKDGEFVGEMSFLTEKVRTNICKVKYDPMFGVETKRI